MTSHIPSDAATIGYAAALRQHQRRDLPTHPWDTACGARLDYFGWRVTYCILDPGHVAGGSLHRSESGINWCCNGKETHGDECVRLVPVPSVVG